MATVQINLPDALAQRARSEGLLSDEPFSGCSKTPCVAKPAAG